MKKLLTLVMTAILGVACVLGMTACGKSDTLYVYTNAGFAPYEYLDANGNVVGIDVDVMNAIGEALGYKVVIKDVAFNTIMTEVQNDKYAVGAAGMSKTDARDAIATASIVYSTSVQYVIAKKGTFTAGQKVTVDEIMAKGKKVGVQGGTTGSYLIEEYGMSEADLEAGKTNDLAKEYKNAILASQDITDDNGQMVVIDKLPAESIVASNDKLECWEIDNPAEEYVIYFNKKATDLVKKVNTELQKLIDDGKIEEFTIKHTANA